MTPAERLHQELQRAVRECVRAIARAEHETDVAERLAILAAELGDAAREHHRRGGVWVAAAEAWVRDVGRLVAESERAEAEQWNAVAETVQAREESAA